MRHTQRGGTFLGLVIGVVIGLALALAVAVYVMRVPVPFMDRGAVQKNGGAADAQKSKDWDPNAPLAGRNPARPASAASAAAAAAPESKASAPVAAAAPGRAASAAASSPARAEAPPATRSETARPAPTPSADPLGDLAKAKAGAAAGPAAPATTADPFAYFVQAGAFRTPEDAEAQRAKLSLQGVEARVSEREQAGRVVYRVRVGPFDSLDAAERVKERLAGAGFDAALVRVQR